jgi:hypothetical protein
MKFCVICMLDRRMCYAYFEDEFSAHAYFNVLKHAGYSASLHQGLKTLRMV